MTGAAWSQPEPSGISQALFHDLGLSGSLRSGYFSEDRTFTEQRDFAVASLWLTARPPASWGIETYFDARIQLQDAARRSASSWDLREGYAQLAAGPLDVRAGRQIIVWGRADKINPTDVWAIRDFTLLAPDDEEQRLGLGSVKATWDLSAYRFAVIWQPEWRYPVLPSFPLPPGVSVRNVEPGGKTSQLGTKLDQSGGAIDWSISYSHSIDRTPDLSVLYSDPSSLLIGLEYKKIDTFGADAAMPLGSYGLRAELAYTQTKDRSGSDALTKNGNFFVVLGGDRTFGGELNVNVQYLYRHTFNFQDFASIGDPSTRALAHQVAITSNQLAEDMHGVSTRISNRMWNETLELELAAVGWFEKSDYTLRPKVVYSFTDYFKGIAGGELYRGPEDSFFGRFRDAATMYVELQLRF